jgi:hypothetical protein
MHPKIADWDLIDSLNYLKCSCWHGVRTNDYLSDKSINRQCTVTTEELSGKPEIVD